MQHTLEVRAFFFNATTDYLPYYKNFEMSLNADDSVEAILSEVQKQNDNFAYPTENLVFKINDLVVKADETVGDVVSRLGTELQIDPVLSYRSNHCLIINDNDFMKSFELLAPYANKEDEAYYQSLYAQHYASETFKFSHDYIGDAVLLLAHRMIANGSEHKAQILEAISDQYDGLAACEYENNLFRAEFHTQAIDELNEMLERKAPIGFLDKITEKLSQKALYSFDKESVEGSNIACYAGDSGLLEEINEKITQSAANVINFPRATKLSGCTLLGKQDNLAYLKAATTLLDALDSGAELLVVAKNRDLDMFSKHFASIQKRIGREIPLPMVSYKAFVELCNTKKELEEA